MFIIQMQALSQNQAWGGKRYKTSKYKEYEEALNIYFRTLDLPKIPIKEKFYIFLEFGVPTRQDATNGTKIFEDVLCRYLGVDDRWTFAVYIRKVVTKKADSYIKFNVFLSEYDLIKCITDEV